MFEFNTIIMFISASVILAFAPGPDNIFVLTQSALFGRKAGFSVTLGLCTGLIFHTVIVAVGLSAIFQTSIIAFNILKYIGVAYLLFLAYKAFRAKGESIEKKESAKIPLRKLYVRGIIMNITNPKVSIFFMAFLPQFADPSNGSMTIQLILLGLLFILSALIVFGFISQVSGWIGKFIFKSPRMEKLLNKFAGTVFAGLAIKLILTEK